MADDLIYVRDHEDYIEDYLSNKSKSFEDDIDHLNDALNVRVHFILNPSRKLSAIPKVLTGKKLAIKQ